MHFQFVLLPDEPASGSFLAADGQHDSIIQLYVWPIPLVLSPYPNRFAGLLAIATGSYELDE